MYVILKQQNADYWEIDRILYDVSSIITILPVIQITDRNVANFIQKNIQNLRILVPYTALKDGKISADEIVTHPRQNLDILKFNAKQQVEKYFETFLSYHNISLLESLKTIYEIADKILKENFDSLPNVSFISSVSQKYIETLNTIDLALTEDDINLNINNFKTYLKESVNDSTRISN